MKTLRKAIGLSVLFVLLFLTACGAAAPAATEAPSQQYQPEVEAPAAAEEYFAPAPTMTAPLAQSQSGKTISGNEPYDMFFEDYGVNPSIDTEDDNLSTFALDVDTGSYTVMRNYLNDGNLPPADSVRVEEYVNYFEQGYPTPSERQTFGVYVDGAPSPFTQSERYDMIRVGIQGYEVSEEDRKDANLVFVIDVSGSMDIEK